MIMCAVNFASAFMKNRFLLIWCLSGVMGCAHSPETVSEKAQRIESLTQALEHLSPQVTAREANQLATVAVNTAAELREKYDVSLTPWLHNTQVYWGLKDRGYCYQYANDLYAELAKVPLQHLQLHFIKAHRDEMLEHNALSVTAAGAPWSSGIVLDAWRNAGVLAFVPVKDDQYPWQLSGKPTAP